MERHVIPISGKDSLATALVQTAREPSLVYEYVFCDVGRELPETYSWLLTVEQKTGWKIQRVGKDLRALIKQWDFLPSHHNRFCTKHAKIAPLEKFYKGSGPVYVYYGLRADEDRVGARPSDTTTHVYPLREMGITLRGVWTILAAQNLLPPNFFWPALHARVALLLGSESGLIDQLPEWEHRMLFAGRTRSNCSFCFYQRQYEWAWQLDVHPELFKENAEIERTTGRTLQKPFTWREGYFIDEKIVQNYNKILDRRAREVSRLIVSRFKDGVLRDHGDTEIALTSCGLLCGK